MAVLFAIVAGAAGALPSAFYTALCVVTAASALPLVHRWRVQPEKTENATRIAQ